MSQRSNSPPTTSSSRIPAGRSPAILQHAPTTPSALREAHTLSTSPEESRSLSGNTAHGSNSEPSHSEASSRGQHTHVETGDGTEDGSDGERTRGPAATRRPVASETTSLLRRPFEIIKDPAHGGPCNHGTFSPHIESPEGSILGFGGDPPVNHGDDGEGSQASVLSGLLSKIGINDQRRKKTSTTSRLAEAHGITNTTSMYVSEPFPTFNFE